MLRSMDGLALRQLNSHPLRSGLTTIGVVLGVGMVFGVLVLVNTIHSTFTDLINSAYSTSNLVVTPKTGGVMPDRTLTMIKQTPGVNRTGEMVGASFVRLDRRGKPVGGQSRVMWVAGFDPASSPYSFRVIAGHEMSSGPEIVLEKNWANAHHLRVGDNISVATPTGRAQLRVVGVFAFGAGVGFGGQGLAAVPLAYARQVMNIPAGWMQISVQAADGGKSAVGSLQRRLERRLGGGVQVQTPRGVEKTATSQLQALNVVLYFFSGVALFVGGFLILNSFNMTVLQRMREIGMLRTLGASPRMIVRNVMVEALAIGLAGTLLGLGFGFLLAHGLVALMKGLGVPIGSITTSPTAVVAAILVGLLVTIAGALRPARHAGRIAPIRAVLGDEGPRRKPSPRRALLGLALFLPGCLLGGSFWMGGGNTGSAASALLGIGMTMAMFIGMALAAPFLIMPILRLLARPLRRVSPTGGRLAYDTAIGNPARTAATAVALTIGLSVYVVNSGFSASFLGTIRDQVNHSFTHDFTVQTVGGGLETGDSFQMAPGVRAAIAKLPGAQVVSPVRTRLVELPGTNASAANGLAIAVEPSTYNQVDNSPYEGASAAAALAGVARGGVIVGPGFAKSAGLHVGSVVRLHGPAGTVRAPVVAKLNSLSEMNGMLMKMSIPTSEAVYGPMNDTQLLVKAAPGQSPALQRETQTLIDTRYPSLELQSIAAYKKHIDSEVSKQFALFNGIILVAVIVSLLGVINTLAMSVIERTREIGVLRALGGSRWLVRRSLLNESLLITLSGAIVGLLLGLVIAFSWVAGLGELLPGIAFHFPVGAALVVAITGVLLGSLASVLPARRAARVDVIRALTYE